MPSLNKKQHRKYKALCDEYNLNCWAIVSFQTFLESKVKATISKNSPKAADLIDIANFAAQDF